MANSDKKKENKISKKTKTIGQTAFRQDELVAIEKKFGDDWEIIGYADDKLIAIQWITTQEGDFRLSDLFHLRRLKK
jgi:hypothetical protein